MPSTCSVIGCKNRSVMNNKVSAKRFFRFPRKDEKKLLLWLTAIGREDWRPTPYSRICSDHFILGETSNNRESPNYVPKIFQHTTDAERRNLEKNYDVFLSQIGERLEKINATTSLISCLEDDLECCPNEELEDGAAAAFKCEAYDNDVSQDVFEYKPDIQELFGGYSNNLDSMEDLPQVDRGTQTLMDDSYLKSLEDEYYKLKGDLDLVKGKDIFRDMELDMFNNNDVKVRSLTGLTSYDMLRVLSDYVSKYQGDQAQGKLTKFQQLMMTLIKIKLNLPMPFLAILFSVSVTTISRMFKITIDILFFRVVPRLVFWPSTNAMRKLVPLEFGECENCMYSVDFIYLEIELRGNASLLDKAIKDDFVESYATSLNVREKKYLITIAPQGLIIYVSKGALAGLDERIIAMESEFFDNVYPGDVVLSHRSFDIEDEVAARGATLKIHRSKKDEIENLVSCRTVINLLKEKFQILDDRIPQNWVKDSEKDDFATSDKIIHIACALLNMSNKDVNYANCFVDNAD